MSIADRLNEVKARIAGAGHATLVAVSKTHPSSAIREAYAAGQRDFGENYAQELAAKRADLADLSDIRWHFIGALQSNKAKLIVPGTALVHAVDRLSVADALSKRAVASGSVCDALIEVNVGGEETKAGVRVEAVESLLAQLAPLAGLRICGLMCIPPAVGDPQRARPMFRTLRSLRDDLAGRYPAVQLLSMGMSGDYEVAISEGATHVRVGTAIFGAREYR